MHTYFSSMAVPFKTAEEIEIELATLGTLFQGRYTRDDKWFAGTCSRGEAQPPRWQQVPVISPWPPYLRRDKFDRRRRGGGGGRYRDSGRGRDFPSRDRGGRGWYDRPPPSGYHGPSHYQQGWQHGRRSPRPDYDHPPPPPQYSRGPWGPGSPPPPGPPPHHPPPYHHGPPPPPPPTHGHSPSHPGPSHHHQQHSSRSGRSRSPWDRDVSPKLPDISPRRSETSRPRKNEETFDNSTERTTTPSFSTDFHTPEEPRPSGEATQLQGVGPGTEEREKESRKLSASSAEEERGSKGRPPPLNLTEVAGLSEVEDKTVPSQSDVDDILSHASFGVNEVNSHNLKRVQRDTKTQSARKPKLLKDSKKQQSSSSHQPPPSRPEERHAHHHATPTHQRHAHHQAPPTTSQNSKMTVSHGPPQDVANPLTRPPAKKRPKTHHHTGAISKETGAVPVDTKSGIVVKETGVVPMDTKPGINDKGHKVQGVKRMKANVSASSILARERGMDELVSKPPAPKKARHRFSSGLSSSGEDSDVDVTTPPDMTTSLSVSFQKSLYQQYDTGNATDTRSTQNDARLTEGNARLTHTDSRLTQGSTRLTQTDAGLMQTDSRLTQSNTANTFDSTRHQQQTPAIQPQLVVSFNRDTLTPPLSRKHHRKKSKKHKAATPEAIDRPSQESRRVDHAPPHVDVTSPRGTGEYQVEFSGDSTKIIFRTGAAGDGGGGGGCGTGAEEHKKKKKHKKKAKKKAKAESHDQIEGAGPVASPESPGNVMFTGNPMKVKIKLDG